jgi:ssDNA thymidine ADP-ribosyltransferase, DarT
VTRPLPTRVFHMTRIERLPSVVEHGLLPDNVCRQQQIAGVEIGYDHIKRRRAQRVVPCGAGGTLADYVPFYFAPRKPMLYAITRGLVSVEAARTDQIVYLVSSIQSLRRAGLTVVASNRHAELDYSEMSDLDGDLDHDGFVDWPLMTARYWNNTPDDPDRKERRQAECLVHPYVPWQAIEGVATKTEQARSQVELVLGTVAAQPARVVVRAEWYF